MITTTNRTHGKELHTSIHVYINMRITRVKNQNVYLLMIKQYSTVKSDID